MLDVPKTFHFLKRYRLEVALSLCIANLAWLLYAATTYLSPGEIQSQRNRDFPNTYISRIKLDLTSPHQYVTLVWSGPQNGRQATGPFHSSVGAGWGTNNCNDPIESNCPDSRCTPKGVRKVEGFAEYLKDHPESRYVTFIDVQRRIGFHSSPIVPSYPASAGCVRLEPYAARLIHDNSIEGVTEIVIDGTWTNPALRENSKAVAEKSSR